MTQYRVSEAAALLGVSDDTVRRWIDAGRLPAVRDHAGRWLVVGRDLAAIAQQDAVAPQVEGMGASSDRNRLPGLVTRVERDGLVARVEIQAGPFRVVSLMPSDAVDELGLEPGVLAVASVAAHAVTVEAPRR
ncbi:MAG: helix-turn-helix domain-containing protein [Actinobacteria bacterium]|nr:helix-turn-helix domain-containing protein [Actinomycetota bacterium]